MWLFQKVLAPCRDFDFPMVVPVPWPSNHAVFWPSSQCPDLQVSMLTFQSEPWSQISMLTFKSVSWPSSQYSDLQVSMLTFKSVFWPSIQYSDLQVGILTFKSVFWPSSQCPDLPVNCLTLKSLAWWACHVYWGMTLHDQSATTSKPGLIKQLLLGAHWRKQKLALKTALSDQINLFLENPRSSEYWIWNLLVG